MMNPDLKPHPIAVCGSQEDRHGIVLAKNYKAKAFGVSTVKPSGKRSKNARLLLLSLRTMSST